MADKDELYQIADELRAIASAGLRYTEGGYDKERYEKILKASARLVAAIENASFEDIFAQYMGNLSHLSPLIAVEAVIYRDEKILLIQRTDDHLWAVPGGLAEVGETLAHAAERELWEEAGVQGTAQRILGIFDSRSWQTKSRLQLFTVMFSVESKDTPALHVSAQNEISSTAEALDVGFFDEAHLPPLSIGHTVRVPMAFKLLRGEIPAPYFDR